MATSALTKFIINECFEQHRDSKIDESMITHDLKITYARAWISKVAVNINQLKATTHVAKYTHGGAKCSRLIKITDEDSKYLSTGNVGLDCLDISGNAAFLNCAKLLRTVVEGQSLMGCIKNNDFHSLSEISESPMQLQQWVDSFEQIWIPDPPISHKLAKQIYFPVGEEYHLLCPLFASSLAQELHKRIKFLEDDKEARMIRDAHKAGVWHSQVDIRFPDLAEVHYGGTKPLNISALNSTRQGKMWLLPSRPPVWKVFHHQPKNIRSLFKPYGCFDKSAKKITSNLVFFIKKSFRKNRDFRHKVSGYVDELIDILFTQAEMLQQECWQGWTLNNMELPIHQQLWLDPWRSKSEESFRIDREKGEWQALIADDFARWLNYHLKKGGVDVGKAELKQWSSKPLFRRRMWEMEAILQEALK